MTQVPPVQPPARSLDPEPVSYRVPEEPFTQPLTAQAAVPLVAGQPLIAQPVAAQPLIAQPVATQPVIAQPVVAQPVVAGPAARAETRRRVMLDRVGWARTSFGPGMVVGGLATLAVLVSCFLPWQRGSVTPSDIPIAFLFDHTANGSGASLLIVLVPLVIMLGIGAFVPMGAGARVFGAIGSLIVAALYVYQLNQALSSFGGHVGDALDAGFYIAVIGAVFAFAAGFLPSGWTTERMVDRREVMHRERID